MNALENQIYLYSLETRDFYTDKEKDLNDIYFDFLFFKGRIKKRIGKSERTIKKLKKEEYFDERKIEFLHRRIKRCERIIKCLNVHINVAKKNLENEIDKFTGVRILRPDSLKSNKIIGLFESSFTRICEFKTDQETDKIFVIRVFHYQILESIIKNGFIYNDREYEYFTSSAGQIRTKKIVCIESSLYQEKHMRITCGLSVDDINKKGGVNTNKYQAYLALTNSASSEWMNFKKEYLDHMVVVDDFSTTFETEVDYIDTKIVDEKQSIASYDITRKIHPITIDHMDGCGIVLPSVQEKSFMFRLPWMKGLASPFDFVEFIKEFKGKTTIKDIYGKEYDIIKDDIKIIFTKSQFKMWKYYKSWDDYKEKFKKYNCEAAMLNIEDIGSKATINYQMLQTLTTMSDDELRKIAQETINDVTKIGNDKNTMLKVLGVVEDGKYKTPFQRALMIYPELLKDDYSQEVIKAKKRKIVREGRAGKLRVNGYYTFIIPDLFAFCEWLFLNEENPKGLLLTDEVHCNIFNTGKVDILRAPHLYREHAIRNNNLSERVSKWFITKGVYTSVHDPISRILQFDNDGDKALVVQDETLISVAEREMKDIVPLYYDMFKAKDTLLNRDVMYSSLTSAYKANIGIISNDITKIWNSKEPNLNAVKWLVAYNNAMIDYAKTLSLPKLPPEKEKQVKSFTQNKVPYFFTYAKDKLIKNVEKTNDSTVNKLKKIIPNPQLKFTFIEDEYDYTNLMRESKTILNFKIIEMFKEIYKSKMSKFTDDNFNHFFKNIREEMLRSFNDEERIVDVLVKYCYENKNHLKEFLWDTYGYRILKNIEYNLRSTIICENCSKRIEKKNNRTKYCNDCSKKINILKTIENRKKKKSV